MGFVQIFNISISATKYKVYQVECPQFLAYYYAYSNYLPPLDGILWNLLDVCLEQVNQQ